MTKGTEAQVAEIEINEPKESPVATIDNKFKIPLEEADIPEDKKAEALNYALGRLQNAAFYTAESRGLIEKDSVRLRTDVDAFPSRSLESRTPPGYDSSLSEAQVILGDLKSVFKDRFSKPEEEMRKFELSMGQATDEFRVLASKKYETAEDAAQALQGWYYNTFQPMINRCRVTVENAVEEDISSVKSGVERQSAEAETLDRKTSRDLDDLARSGKKGAADYWDQTASYRLKKRTWELKNDVLISSGNNWRKSVIEHSDGLLTADRFARDAVEHMQGFYAYISAQKFEKIQREQTEEKIAGEVEKDSKRPKTSKRKS